MPVVRWTAPVAADYRILAKWLDLNPINNGGSAHVVINGQQVFGEQQSGTFIGQVWEDEGNAMMPTQTFRLQAGAVVDFVLSTRTGDTNTDDTAFTAAIVRVPRVAITSPTAEVFEGADVPITVSAQHNYPITAIKLLIDGQAAPLPEDETAPYQFTLPDVEAGTYYLTAVARDESDAETASDGTTVIPDLSTLKPLKLVVKKGGPAAAARAERTRNSGVGRRPSAGGVTFRCTKSGLWKDPATWGGIGVPGKNDDAIIPQGFQVTYENVAGAPSLEIHNLELAGRLVSNRGLVVFGKMQASGSVVGFADPDAFVLTIDTGALFVNVAGQAIFENVIFTNYGTVILAQDGRITSTRTSFVNSGTVKILPPPGSNRPTIAVVRGVEIKGGVISLGNYTQLITRGANIVAAGAGNIVAAGGGNIVAAGAGNIVAAGAGNLIGSDGASLIGPDGASLIGSDGASIVAAGAGNIVAAGAGNLIGSDGASIVAAGAGNLVGRPAESAEAAADPGTISLGGGTVSGNLNLVGDVSNTGAFISPGNSAGKIRIAGKYTQGAGGTLLLEVGGTTANPPKFDQLQITGTATLGGKLIVKTIDGFTPQSSTNFAPLTYASVTGNFANVTSNAQITLGPQGMTMKVSGPNPPAPRALNISTRLQIQSGDNVLFAGFIVTGPAGSTKKVLIRGIGPSLAQFGVAGTIPDPLLELHSSGPTVINDNWEQAPNKSEIPPAFVPKDSRESVIIATLPPGNYSAILKGAHGETGVGLAEVYDFATASPAQLANISTRGFVQTADNVLIGGFIIAGNEPAKVMVLAIGPSLASFGLQGVLLDPELEVHDANGGVIGNDNWRSTQETEIRRTGLAPTHDKESAVLATLTPGNYTAVVRGKNDTTGIGVVQAYNIP
jgi:hypothetical protein